MQIKPTVDEVKRSAILLQYGDTHGHQKSITDEHISSLIEDISADVKRWINQNNISISDEKIASYNVKRLVILEVIINLALSYYNSRGLEDDYIGSIKKERDYYRDLLKENMRRFTGSMKTSKVPRLKNGNVFL